MSGLFVTIDGPAGVGKTTTVRLLAQCLADRGYRVYATAEPSGGLLGETARHHTETYRGHSLACLVAADRYHHLATEIRPHLHAGHIVICDRYVASSYVLQRMDGVPRTFVEAINSAADRPDLAIVLRAPSAIVAARVAARGAHNRFHAGQTTSEHEIALYEEAVQRLAARRYPILAIDTGDAPPGDIADHLVTRIADLKDHTSRNVATA
ncbi:dTMP kinase [Amycolatopsis magusensis]|uniref:Thymidylate kinase n=1 Tax=Amycolatopsis magusensis TaxID=882444 RepID=A0ABS4Q4W1_9PSEU|nr:dTMP kinase [Amycolatopsis magusensis]MBP2186721.1 dTMP kinase [Amycolatopsis magusensis]